MSEARRILQLCDEAANQIYNAPPSHMYATNVALLLAGTAATESHLRYRRQVGYKISDMGGAWGLWQTESLPMGDNVRYLRAHPEVRERAAQFLHQGNGDLDAILSAGNFGLCKLCAGWDRFAVLIARVHYLRQPGAIPCTDEKRAEYWKKNYNTYLGKGTPAKYLADYKRLIAPWLKAGL